MQLQKKQEEKTGKELSKSIIQIMLKVLSPEWPELVETKNVGK